MNKIVLAAIPVFIASVIIFTAFENSRSQDTFKYVGVTTCVSVCHKGESKGNQLEIWQSSKHSNAMKTLQTPEADKIASDRGSTTAAAETPECVKCHTLGKELVESELESTFNKSDGVQCETCHGPGSEYKKLTIMKDREKAIQNGLVIHNEGELFCVKCHNNESPTFKGFKYDEYWEKIKHPKPTVVK
ncbi:MAG: cytochrome C554 [Ignavibacteriae bacterium]|nr:MAG: cytochrome C554 [Ignavibacteriota bacterium]